MIIEDSGEQTSSRHYVGNIFKKRKVVFKREEIRIDGVRVGDYVGQYTDDSGEMYYGWIVERKRTNDFLSSAKDGRLESQYEKMSKLCRSNGRFVIIEGDWYKLMKNNLSQVGLMMSMMLKASWYNVNVIKTKNEQETAAIIVALERYHKAFENLNIKEHLPEIKKNLDLRIRPLMCVEGIGEKKAIAILEKFDSLEEIIDASKNNVPYLTSIKGIGTKIVQKIKELFTNKEPVKNGVQRNRRNRNGLGQHGRNPSRFYGRPNTAKTNYENVYRGRENH